MAVLPSFDDPAWNDQTMTQREVVVLEDDIDGGSGDETVYFGLDGQDWEIDLSRVHADQLRAILRPWLQVARPAGRAPRAASFQVETPADPRAVRAWATARGIDFPSKGRIPQHVIDQFHAAGN